MISALLALPPIMHVVIVFICRFVNVIVIICYGGSYIRISVSTMRTITTLYDINNPTIAKYNIP